MACADAVIKAFENKRVEQVAQDHRCHSGRSGSAVLAKACQDKGFRALVVDWTGNNHKPSYGTTRLNLQTSDEQEALLRQFKTDKVKFAWFAPPCGAFTRAQELITGGISNG